MTQVPQTLTSFTPGTTTLGALREAARLRAGMPSPTAKSFVNLTEWNNNINDSAKELHALKVESYGDGYSGSGPNPFTFVTDGQTDFYPLPADLLKFKGVDWVRNVGDPSQNRSLKPLSYSLRNRPRYPWGAGPINQEEIRYIVEDNFLWLKPRPPAGMNILIRYVPRLQPMVDTGLIYLKGVAANDTFVVNGSTFTCLSSGPAGNDQFVVGVTDVLTAQNFAAAINASTDASISWLLSAVAGSAGPTGTLGLVTVTLLDLVTVSGATTTTPWAGNNNHWRVVPNYVFTNVLDGINGWEELVVIDATIKALVKQESFQAAQVWIGLKAQKLAKIESEANNRDLGSPARQADVTSRRFHDDDGDDGY